MLIVYASLVLLAAPVFAQTPSQGECTEEGKAALYTGFTTFRTTDPTKAYEAGKKYLACSQQEDQYTAYLKKWVTAYEKESRKLKLQPLLYNDKKYAEAFALGKEILADEPDNLRVLTDLGYGGYLATVTSKNESFNNESLGYARKAIQLIESGKTLENWSPFKSKEDALAYLYNAIGRLTLKNNSPETLTSLIKAARFDADVKKDPWIYYFIGAAYESGPYAKLSADYKKNFEGKDESPESKLALANIHQVIDRMIDAYARAVALAGTDPKYQATKNDWMESLSTWYKFRHDQSDAGLKEMVASIISKPLPPEPAPLTTLPATAPTSTTTPTSGSMNTSGSVAGASVATPPKSSTTPVSSSSSTTLKTTTTSAAPVSTTPASVTSSSAKAPVKPKTRSNNRRH